MNVYVITGDSIVEVIPEDVLVQYVKDYILATDVGESEINTTADAETYIKNQEWKIVKTWLGVKNYISIDKGEVKNIKNIDTYWNENLEVVAV